MAYGKAIELFLVNGTAESLITAELSNWNGKAIKIPRTEVSACDREDIKGVGIYFLICQEDDGTDSVYIGEAENVLDRLTQHLRDYQSGKEQFAIGTIDSLTRAVGLFKQLQDYEDSPKKLAEAEQRLVELQNEEKERKENIYKDAIQLLNSDSSSGKELASAEAMFRSIPDYKDAKELAAQCDTEIRRRKAEPGSAP